MTWVLLTTRSSWQAELLLGALTAEGIRVRLERNALGSVYGQHTFATKVLVAEEDAMRAVEVLQELEQE